MTCRTDGTPCCDGCAEETWEQVFAIHKAAMKMFTSAVDYGEASKEAHDAEGDYYAAVLSFDPSILEADGYEITEDAV